MKKFIIKKILTAKELSKLGRKILTNVSAHTLSRVVAECADSFGEAQEYIVAQRCYEDAILRCTTMLCCPSAEILRVLVEREKYHALCAANLEEMDSFCVSKLLDVLEMNDRLRLKVLTECQLDLFALSRIKDNGDHLELLLTLKNRRTEKFYSNYVSWVLARKSKEEISAMIEKGVSPNAWHLLLETPGWQDKVFERLENTPLDEWAEDVGKYVFAKGSDTEQESFMRIFCKRFAKDGVIIPYEVVGILVANKDSKYLIEYFEAEGLLDQNSYALISAAGDPEVIKAMKVWPAQRRIVKK